MGFFKPSTQQVGGGSAAGTANQFNNFLSQGLQTGSFGGGSGAPKPPGMGNDFMPQGGGSSNGQNGMSSGQASQQQQNLFGGAINNLLGGQSNSPNVNSLVSQASQYSPQYNMPNAPQFQGANFGNQPGYQATNFQNVNNNIQGGSAMQGLQNYMQPAADTGAQGIASFLSSFGLKPNEAAQAGGGGFQGGQGASFTPGKLLNYNIDSPEFKALNDLNQRRTMQDTADLRSRFALEGNSLGSGASLAEAQLRAEANPRNILAMGELGRSMQGMDLQQQDINNQGAARVAGINAGMAGAAMNNEQFNAQMRQRNNEFLGNQAANILQGNQGFNLGQLGQANSALQNDTGNALQAAGMNNQATQMNNQNIFGDNQGLNQFNQQMFGQNSQNALGNAQMQNQFAQNIFGQQSANALNQTNGMNDWMANLGNMGINLAQLGQQGQLGAMGQLFGAYNNANALGTPQAQMVQKPSGFSQVLGAAGQIAGMIPGFRGISGGGNPIGQIPNVNPGAWNNNINIRTTNPFG